MFSFLPKIRFTPSILISIDILKNKGNTTDFHSLRRFRVVGLQLSSAFLSLLTSRKQDIIVQFFCIILNCKGIVSSLVAIVQN